MATYSVCARPGCLENRPSPSDRAYRYVQYCAHGSRHCAAHVFMPDELTIVDAHRGVLWTGSLSSVAGVALLSRPRGLIVEIQVSGAPGSKTTHELGPWPEEDAKAMASSLRKMTSRDELVPLAAEVLKRTPGRFHGWLISTEGIWSYEFESSHFAGAWLTWPRGSRAPGFGAARRIQVLGLWLSANGLTEEPTPGTESSKLRWGGYGHMGMSPAELIAYELKFLD